jgi:hypothetical protein
VSHFQPSGTIRGKTLKKSKVDSRIGGPERTRTSDLRFRKPLLYPAELRDHYVDVVVVRVAVNERTSSLRQHARNSIVSISGVKPPQALVTFAF